MGNHLDKLLKRVVNPRLAVNSGVYPVVDPNLTISLNHRGEYESPELDASYAGPAESILRVSAFGGEAPNEAEIAKVLYGHAANAEEDLVAGWTVGAFAGFVNDPDDRARSSSGGLATWVLRELLRVGEIDGVIHMKATPDSDALFNYAVSRSDEAILDGAKTRYYPGEMSAALQEVAAIPGRYAVVGIPSFIYEVRLLQTLDPIFKERIAFTLGLICGHQKTANYAEYLAWRAGIEPGSLADIDFRKKASGRRANDYSTEFFVESGGRVHATEVRSSDLHGTDWGLGYFKSNFSDFTEDALNETADIVFGDAWLPAYTADSRGTNVVLVRDQRLLEILRRGEEAGSITLEEISVDEVVKSQGALIRQAVTELPYRMAWLSKRKAYTPQLRRSALEPLSWARRQIQQARLASSRMSHVAYLRARTEGQLRAFDSAMLPTRIRYRLAQRLERATRRFASATRKKQG